MKIYTKMRKPLLISEYKDIQNVEL